jgi:hypothetical protein
MIEIERKRGVNLSERKMRMLQMDFVRAPAVGDVVQCDLDDLDVSIINPCLPFTVTPNVARRVNDAHGFLVIISTSLPRFGRKTNSFAAGRAADHVDDTFTCWAAQKSQMVPFGMMVAGSMSVPGCITLCYIACMKTVLVPVRLDEHLRAALCEGVRQTRHNQQDLIRLTLHRHLRTVIQQEAMAKATLRVTNVKPWPRRVVEKAYQRIGKEWDSIEDAAILAQGTPGSND